MAERLQPWVAPRRREVLSIEDLRVIAKAIRGYRASIQHRAKINGSEPRGIAQMDRIERIVERLIEARQPTK